MCNINVQIMCQRYGSRCQGARIPPLVFVVANLSESGIAHNAHFSGNGVLPVSRKLHASIKTIAPISHHQVVNLYSEHLAQA